MNKTLSTKMAAASAFVTMVIVGFATAAHAAPVDPTGGALGAAGNDAKTWVTTYGVPAVFILLGTGIIVALALRLGNKLRSAV